MRFMLAVLPATGALDALVMARCPDRIFDAKQGWQAGLNPAAIVFGPPGQDIGRIAGRKPH
jgi:hypothetical protein